MRNTSRHCSTPLNENRSMGLLKTGAQDIKHQALRLTAGLANATVRRRTVVDFARQHKLIYFRSVQSGGQFVPVIRGSTASPDQTDMNFCIGTHAGYDLALLERTGTVAFE